MNLIYDKSPVFFQNLLVSAYGWYWKKRRFGGVFQKELNAFRDRNSYSEDEWQNYQTLELRKLLVHAYENVPYYSEKYSKEGLTRNDFKRFNLDDLNKLPYLEKEDLRKYGKTTLLSKKKNKGSFYSSSGSTGTPTSIFYSPEFHQKWSAAFEVRIREWAGIDNSFSRGMIGGRKILGDRKSPPFYRVNKFENQVYFSAYDISKKNLYSYFEGMQKNKVQYMTGYAMSNYILAQEFESAKIVPPKMKAVITSSEKLTPKMRKTLGRVYRCDVFDSYSGVEACGLISESPNKNLLFSPDTGIMEVIDLNGNSINSGDGEVISTGFLNYDQPLIRYRIGDRISISNEIKDPEFNMPVVQGILGRVEDVIIGPEGQKMVRFHSVFTEIEKLISGQIIQHSIDQIEIRLVVENNFNVTDNEKLMIKRIEYQLGTNVRVHFSYSEELIKTKSGKVRSVISYLN